MHTRLETYNGVDWWCIYADLSILLEMYDDTETALSVAEPFACSLRASAVKTDAPYVWRYSHRNSHHKNAISKSRLTDRYATST